MKPTVVAVGFGAAAPAAHHEGSRFGAAFVEADGIMPAQRGSRSFATAGEAVSGDGVPIETT